MDVDVDLHVSLFDFLILVVMSYGIYKGYVQGFIVQTIALFVLLAGVFVSVKLSLTVHNLIIDKSTVALPNFPVMVFAILFGMVVFASNWVALIVKKQILSLPRPITTRVLGAFFGAVKYMFIISIMLLFIDRIDSNFQIIPKKEEARTIFYKPFLKFAPTVLPKLKFHVREPKLMEIPDIEETDVPR